MAVGHLRLRKIILLIILILLAGGVVAASVFANLSALQIVGLSIIAVVLFFSLSRRIYPARRILTGSPDDESERSEDKTEDETRLSDEE